MSAPIGGGRIDARTSRTRLAGPVGPIGPTGPIGADGILSIARTQVATGIDSRATWVFPGPYNLPPFILATVIDDNPADAQTVAVVVEEVTLDETTVRVYRTQTIIGLGLLPMIPAGPDVLVNLAALSF